MNWSAMNCTSSDSNRRRFCFMPTRVATRSQPVALLVERQGDANDALAQASRMMSRVRGDVVRANGMFGIQWLAGQPVKAILRPLPQILERRPRRGVPSRGMSVEEIRMSVIWGKR